MGIFNVIIWLPGAPAGARLPEHSSSCRVQSGCEVGSGRREPAERVGETFHLVKVPASAQLRAVFAAAKKRGRRLGLVAVAGRLACRVG